MCIKFTFNELREQVTEINVVACNHASFFNYEIHMHIMELIEIVRHRNKPNEITEIFGNP